MPVGIIAQTARRDKSIRAGAALSGVRRSGILGAAAVSFHLEALLVAVLRIAALVIFVLWLASCSSTPEVGLLEVRSTEPADAPTRTAWAPGTPVGASAPGDEATPAAGWATPAVSAAAPLTPPAGVIASPSPIATPSSFMPSIDAFSCEPCAVEPGESATLRWDVTGAIWVTLDDRGVVAPGSAVVQPDQTTTYRLIAANENGRSEKTLTVEVRGLPVIHTFTCMPCQVSAGEPSTLSWDLSGGTAAYLDGLGVTAPGSTVLVPDKTTTYHLEAVGERGSVERLVTVTVIEGGNPDTVNRSLSQLGYRVRSVNYQPLARGGQSVMVAMAAACDAVLYCGQVASNQIYWGLKVLYDNYPGRPLSVGLYDGMRHTVFATVESAAFEGFLRGELDGPALWRAVQWNVWDDWSGRWLPADGRLPFAQKDFASKGFAR